MGDYAVGSLLSVLDTFKDNIHMMSFNTKVVGTTFRPNGQNILKYLARNVKSYDIVLEFEREPDNQYDPNAVKVIVGIKSSVKKHHIGYIPKDISDFFAHVIDCGRYDITVDKVTLVGGISGFDNYGMEFDYRVSVKSTENS